MSMTSQALVGVAAARPDPQQRAGEEMPADPGDPDAPPPDQLPPLPVEPAQTSVPDDGSLGDLSSLPPSASALAVTPGDAEPEPVEELVERRTATSDVFVNDDGSATMRLYSEPQYYVAGRAWVPISNAVVADASRPGWYRNAANSWAVRFGPITGSTANAIEVTDGESSFGFTPVPTGRADAVDGAAPVEPEADGSSVLYRDVWPGADLRYTVRGGSIKEDIIIRERATSEFVFSASQNQIRPAAPRLSPAGELLGDRQVGFDVVGTNLRIAAPETFDSDGRPVDKAAGTAAQVEAVGAGSELTVSVDDAWLEGLDDGDLPVVVDPSISVGASAWANFKSDGTIDTAVPSQRTGNVLDSGDKYWRGLVGFPYDQVWQNYPGALVTSAQLGVTLDAGSTSVRQTQAREATTLSYGGVGTVYDTEPVGSSGSLDVTEPIALWVATHTSNKAFFLTGEETPGVYTYKRFVSSLQITFNRPPPVPSPQSPADGQTVASTTPNVSTTSVTDPDGQTVQYAFRVATNPDGTGGFIHSGLVPTPQFTVPQGMLRNGQTYYWQAYAFDGVHFSAGASTLRSIRVDQRLGLMGPAPMHAVGPVQVNMSTGNATMSTATPTFPTVGGDLGFNLSYDSLGSSALGLRARYYVDADTDGVFDTTDPVWLERTDPQVAFDWATGGPESLAGDGFLVRWEGTLRVPTAGSWQFGVRASGGARVKLGSSTVVNAWTEGTAPELPVYGSAQSLTADAANQLTVEFSELTGPGSVEFWLKGPGFEGITPTAWLSNGDRILPAGWEMSADVRGISWVRARKNDASVTLFDPTGRTVEFPRVGSGASAGYRTPAGYNDTISVNPVGGVVVSGEDGTTYTFRPDGQLASARSAVDGNSTAPIHTWTPISSGGPVRLTEVADSVAGRSMTLSYQGGSASCPTATGFDAPPAGMLCGVQYWDGTATDLMYVSGRLARIVNPGASVTDYGYDGQGRVTSVREPRVMDAIAATVVPNDTTTRAEIVYGGDGRVIEARPPMANTFRPVSTFVYGNGETRVQVSGTSQPNGFTRKVTFDSAGRVLNDTDATNRTASTAWSAQDQVLYTTDLAGSRTSTIYDGSGRVTRTWGPAPASCFSGQNPTASCTVPGTQTFYDEGINGLAATYWKNQDLDAFPSFNDTGVGDTTGALNVNWGTGSPAGLGDSDNDHWSARFTGEILLPQTGNYGLALLYDDGARLWIDDQPIVDKWVGGSGLNVGYFNNPTPNTRHRVRVEYYDNTGPASITLYWQLPSNPSNTVVVPGANLFPAYGLPTREVDQAGRTTTTTFGSTTGTGLGPEHGRPTRTTTDPSGLNLQDQTGYEPPGGSGYMRVTSRTLPAGNATHYTNYGASETRDNPCTTASDPANQAGRRKLITSPDPDGGGSQSSRAREFVYDSTGRTVAERVVGDASWTCTQYDLRGRVTQVDYPAFSGQPARTVTNNYAVTSNPLYASTSDAAGSVEELVDLQGRPIAYRDVWGNVTFIEYDAAGLPSNMANAHGSTRRAYDPAGRLTEVSVDDKVAARVVYDPGGRTSQITFPVDDGNAGNGVEGGNGTHSAPIAYDDQGRVASVRWETSGGALITSDQVTRNLAGDVIDEVVDGVDPQPTGPNFSYDNARRLVDAYVPSLRRQYQFAASSSCGSLTTAGKNADRTAQVSTPTGGTATTTTYCYDNADRLTSSSDPAVGTVTYDPHGNSTAIFGESHTFDGADRHVQTVDGSTTIDYKWDATNRIVSRQVNGASLVRYGSAMPGDSPTHATDASGALLQKFTQLPGGVMLTTQGLAPSRWSYPNIHGDLTAVADQAGVKVGSSTTYDPFGNVVGGTVPDNVTGTLDYGPLGQFQRGLEHEPGFEPITEMGARQYSPRLGRFLEADPIDRGSANDYDYADADPLNKYDLNGESVYGCAIAWASAILSLQTMVHYCRAAWYQWAFIRNNSCRMSATQRLHSTRVALGLSSLCLLATVVFYESVRTVRNNCR